jgi:predicted RNA binding protein YcfA (HicA-like mRNA interferase family)
MAHVPTQTNERRGDPGDPRVKPISGKRLCKLLESRGWVLDHIRGSHQVYTHPNASRPIPVPVHANRNRHAGTQRSIKREAGGIDNDV